MSKASVRKTEADRLVDEQKAKRKLFGLERQRFSGLGSSDFGSIGTSGGNSAVDTTGQYLKVAGDTMIGPIAFYPRAVIISGGQIDIGSTTTGYSSKVVVTGEGAVDDDLDTILNAGFAGQLLILYAILTNNITLKHNTGNIFIPAGNDVVIEGGHAVILQFDTVVHANKWVVIGGEGAGDNLGNHIATQQLNMSTNEVIGISLAQIVDTGSVVRGTISGDTGNSLIISNITGGKTIIQELITPLAEFDSTRIDFYKNLFFNAGTEAIKNAGHIQFSGNSGLSLTTEAGVQYTTTFNRMEYNVPDVGVDYHAFLIDGELMTTITRQGANSGLITVDYLQGDEGIFVQKVLDFATYVNATPIDSEMWFEGGQFRFREGGVTKTLGGGAAQTPWLSDINADGWDLRDLSVLQFRDAASTPADAVALYSDGITLFSKSDLNMNIGTIQNVDLLQMVDTGGVVRGTISGSTGNALLISNIIGGKTQILENITVLAEFDSTRIDFFETLFFNTGSEAVKNVSNVQFSGTTGLTLTTEAGIEYSASNYMRYNAPLTLDDHRFTINGELMATIVRAGSNSGIITANFLQGDEGIFAQKVIDFATYVNASPTDSEIWFEGGLFRFREGGVTKTLGGGGLTEPLILTDTNKGSVSGAVNVDWSQTNYQRLVVTGDTTLTMINLPVTGKSEPLILTIVQDGVGGHAVSITNAFENGFVPVVSKAVDAVTTLGFYNYDNVNGLLGFNTSVIDSFIRDATERDTVLPPASTTVPVDTFRMPRGMQLVDVKASLKVAGASGIILVDVHADGTTIFSTKINLDPAVTTSKASVIQPVISTVGLSDDSKIEIFLDAIDATNVAKELKVSFIGFV